MANSGFRYTPDIRAAMEPWREKLGRDYESVVARLTDRDRALEDYVNRIIYDRINALVTFGGGETISLGAWTGYTPALTAATLNPTIGTGSQVQTGAYSRTGRTIVGWARIKFGTVGAAAGVGIYSLALPVAAATSAVNNAGVGAGHMFDSSAAARQVINAFCNTSTTMLFIVEGFEVAQDNQPWTWAAGDEIVVSFTYEAAA